MNDRISDNQGSIHELFRLLAHQLRTPLAVIQLNLDLLQKEIGHKIEPNEIELMTEMRHAMRRMYDAIGDILQIGSIEAGIISREPKELCAQDCIRDLFAAYHALMERKGVTMRWLSPEEEKTRHVEDPHLLNTVLDTIILNAVQYSPSGGVIGVAVLEDDRHLTIRIFDQGPGIPTEKREKIFHRGYRLKGNAETAHGGSGMGLYLARLVMDDLIEGSIQVDDNPEGGTIFNCFFPRR